MKRHSLGIIGFLAALSFCLAAATEQPGPTTGPAADEDGISIYFSPDGGAQDAIVSHINSARQSIDVQCFHFTAAPLAAALMAAKDRGVDVRVVIDAKAVHEPACQANALRRHGIPVYVDAQYHTAHNKIMIFDDSAVLTGSYNYTLDSAQRNAENAVFIADKPNISAAYVRNFQEHLAHSQLLTADAPVVEKAKD
jgi:phosphatidylserine/phosphatidylglycerophosphate/cardiolipin synthase-like enzyme